MRREPKRPKARGLGPHQRKALMDHLSDGLQLAEIRRLMVVIEEQLPLVGLIEVPLDDDRRHMVRVARAAKALQAALDKARPPMALEDDVETFGWEKFDATLAELHQTATLMAKGQPARRRGRPRKQAWRDELITVVWNAYPAEHRKKTRDGHFEHTVEMLLRFLGAPVEDVHVAVISALTRR